MRWLGNIIISIAASNLDEIYSCTPIEMVSPLVSDSTITILEKSLEVFNSNIPVRYHKGRTIIVEMYGHSNHVDGIRIDSCLGGNETKSIIETMLDSIQ